MAEREAVRPPRLSVAAHRVATAPSASAAEMPDVSPRLTPTSLRELQRTAGNSAVTQLLSRHGVAHAAPSVLTRDTRPGVYDQGAKDLDPSGNPFSKAFEKLSAQQRLHGAQVGGLVDDDQGLWLTLTLPAPVNATVTVTFTLADVQATAAPSTLVLTPPGAANQPWTAAVHVAQKTRVDDLVMVLGHELDEISQRVATGGAAGGAGVYDPNAAPATPETAHDTASAAELVNLLVDYKKLQVKKNPVATPQELANRKQSIERLTVAMGLDQPANIAVKTALLRAVYAQLPKADRDRYEDKKPEESLLEETMEEARQAGSGAVSVGNAIQTDAELLGHLRYSDLSDDFATKGLSGGHDDAAMHTFLRLNAASGIVVVPDPNPVAIPGGGQFIVYEQFQWQFPGGQPVPAPANRPQHGDAGSANWVKAAARKTTATNFDNFLASAERAFVAWQQQKEQDGHFATVQPKQLVKLADGNQGYEMYVESDDATPPKIKVHTLYPKI